ncbi:hypothetical protein GCM10028805_08300 [Spirosoma harenae]
MKKYLFSIILLPIVLFNVFSVQAATPKPIWYSGKVILWDKTSLEGDLSYNWLLESILFRQLDGRILTFSTKQVSQFGWFDFSVHKYRNFKALDNNEVKDQVHQSFFEICQDGPLIVVRRIKPLRGLRKHMFTNPTYYADQPSMVENSDLFDYFVYDAGRLRNIDRFHSEVYLPLMTTYDKQLQTYVQRHNINNRSLFGRLLLIHQYNMMVEQDAKLASTKATGIAPE